MKKRCARAGNENISVRHRVRALEDHVPGKICGELLLRDARTDVLLNPVVGPDRDLAGRPRVLNLLRRLVHAEVLDDTIHRSKLCICPGETVLDAAEHIDIHIETLKADFFRAGLLRERCAGRRDRPVLLSPLNERIVRALRARKLRIPRVRDEELLIARDKEKCVVARVAADVADIHELRAEKCVQLLDLQVFPDPFQHNLTHNPILSASALCLKCLSRPGTGAGTP